MTNTDTSKLPPELLKELRFGRAGKADVQKKIIAVIESLGEADMNRILIGICQTFDKVCKRVNTASYFNNMVKNGLLKRTSPGYFAIA